MARLPASERLEFERAAELRDRIAELKGEGAAADDLDLGDDRRVHREGSLDTHAEAHLADLERLAHAGTLAADEVDVHSRGRVCLEATDLYVLGRGDTCGLYGVISV